MFWHKAAIWELAASLHERLRPFENFPCFGIKQPFGNLLSFGMERKQLFLDLLCQVTGQMQSHRIVSTLRERALFWHRRAGRGGGLLYYGTR